ncbi:disks large-associated protein 5 [Bombus impatiens]|uniref:Disks large-associated protein 5 n=1 Tax=Bombus impatiens TaxID=132113 RepID=A0A6P3V560_BOMIM|nr:disks large-associated protein 5 [Bombus impatiens]
MLQRYKACNARNTEKNRIIRAARYKESRKSYRAKAFNENRNISNTAINIQDEKAQTDPAVEDRLLRLEKWKAEREKRKKVEQRTKKRPFIVGVVHHKIYSPITTTTPVNTLTTTSKSLPKRVTRATEKRLMNKANEKKNAENSSKNLNVPNKNQRNQKKAVKSFAPEGHKFKAPPGLPKMPLFGKVVVQSMSPARLSQLLNSPKKMTRASIKNHSTEFIEKKNHLSVTDTEDSSVESISLKLSVSDKETPSDNEIHNNNSIAAASSLDNNMSTSIWSSSPCEPAFFSPHIVSSRGKSNARKEQQLRRGFSLTRSSDNDIPTKDTVMKNLNISIEEEERTAQYFHFLLNKEINRLNELCEKWAEIKTKPDTTDDGQYEINQAIGQTKLLISKKFERFRRLVNDCETGKGEMLVTCKDLQGFWDMMYIEVRNCDVRFEKLENLRAHAWKEEELFAQRPVAKKKVVKKKVVSTKPSSVRAFLAKKKMKLRNSGDAKELKSKSIISSENEIISVRDDKRLSLLQKVQSSETPKIAKSPLTIIKISQMCKTPKIQLDDSISYINSNRTPGKSILKQQKNFNEIESTVKSANKINFNDHIILNEVSIDEETQTKMDLAAVLSKIDSFDSTEMKINAEKKLYFDDSDSDEDDFDNEDKIKKSLGSRNSADRNIHKIPIIRVEKATPLQEVNKRFNTPFRKITRQNAVDEDESVLDGTFTLDKTNKETSDDIDSSTLNDKLKKYSISSNEETNDQTDNVRILRNRIVTSTGTPMPRRRSSRRVSGNIQETEYKENETPMDRRRRKSRFKINASNNEKTNIELLCYSCNDISLDKSSDKRRSTRSVKFSGIEKECSNRTNKPIQPLTPHVKKSKRKSRSMSMETSGLGIEEKSSQRISRRSQNKKL